MQRELPMRGQTAKKLRRIAESLTIGELKTSYIQAGKEYSSLPPVGFYCRQVTLSPRCTSYKCKELKHRGAH